MRNPCKKARILLIGAAATLACSCTTIQHLPKEMRTAEESGAEYECAEKVIAAVLEDDYRTLSKQITPELREQFGKEEFEKVREEAFRAVGEPVSYLFFSKLEMTAFSPYVWKVRFVRTKENGEKIYTETMFRVITGMTEDGPVAVAFSFI